MKKQQWQWLFKVFSKTLTTPLLNSSTSSYNIVRPFCVAATPTPTPTNPSLFDVNSSNNKLHMLSEKKLPLLIVPSSTKEREVAGYYSSVCNDTLGFISFFHADGDGDDHDHFDQLNKKKEEEVYKVYLPEIANRRICGSSEGWLITVHENSEIQLLNPISRVLVHLPPLTAFPEVVGKFVSEEIVGEDLVPEDRKGLCYLVNGSLKNNLGSENRPPRQSYDIYGSHHFQEYFLVKVVTNTDANSTTSVPTVVMAICGLGKLAFCRPNGIDEPKRWIRCLEDYGGNERNNYQDVTFYKGNFYAVRPSGDVVVVKGIYVPSPPFLEVIIQKPSPPLQQTEFEFYPHENYLVESQSSSSSSGGGGSGDLLKVMRYVVLRADEETETETEEESDEEKRPYRTYVFRVLKLDFDGPSWEEVTNLGEDCALFVGYNRSFSFSASKFSGCRGNCIYFTDNIHEYSYTNPNGGHDMGVYDLKDGSIEKFCKCSSQSFMPPPVWYMPAQH